MDYLAQGTIYPDVIESGAGDAAVIKSHHNVGGLPDYVDFKEIIEPLRLLFKDEVRAAGPGAGPAGVSGHASALPRPGSCHPDHRRDLTKEKLDTLRDADAIFREEIANAGLDTADQPVFRRADQYPLLWASWATAGPTTIPWPSAAVTTSDFMTADWARIPYEVLDKI